MTTDELNRSLSALFGELVHGPPATACYVLNRGDAGLLAALDRLSPEDASASRDGGATIAAHAEHLRYGLSLMNRWAAGEDAFADAGWAQAWNVGKVTEYEWAELRRGLRDEIDRWHSALRSTGDVAGVELDGLIASVVHLAYHLGAIRQIHRNARGPKAND